MAIQIPDSPNIIGSEPVLRSPDQAKGETLAPQFKVNTKAEQEVVQAVGGLLADVNQTRIDTYMTQASLWWTENMNKRVREITDPVTGIKGKNAMDLYVTHIKPYAKQLTDDLTGAPKNDDVVRISNPQLQTAFKKWVDSQLPNYNAQIARYEGQELAKYNESTFDAREQQITDGLMNATTEEEIVGYSQSMLDLNRIRYRGYNSDRITQLAAAKVDAAVLSNVKSQVTNDVEKGYSYYTSPQIQGVLSSKSKAEIKELIKKEFVGQISSRGGEEMASGTSKRLGEMTSDDNIKKYMFTDDPITIEGTRKDIYSKAQTRSDALTEKAEGVRSQIAANLGTELANVKTEEELLDVRQRIGEFDVRWGEQIDNAIERDKADRLAMWQIKTLGLDNGDIPSNATREEIIRNINEGFAASKSPNKNIIVDTRTAAMMATVRDMELAGISHEEAVDIVATDAANNSLGATGYAPETQAMVDKYNALRERAAEQSKVFTEIENEINTGVWVQGYDSRMDKLTTKQQQELQAMAATEQEYRRLINSHPEINNMIQEVDATYPQFDLGFRNRAKRQIIKDIQSWEGKASIRDTAGGEQLRRLVLAGYEKAKTPTYEAMEAAIYGNNIDTDFGTDSSYWAREARTDVMAEVERRQDVINAGKALLESKNEKNVSDRELDDHKKWARKKIQSYRDSLPKDMRAAVDENFDMYVEWYILGLQTEIMQNTERWYDLNRR